MTGELLNVILWTFFLLIHLKNLKFRKIKTSGFRCRVVKNHKHYETLLANHIIYPKQWILYQKQGNGKLIRMNSTLQNYLSLWKRVSRTEKLEILNFCFRCEQPTIFVLMLKKTLKFSWKFILTRNTHIDFHF